MADLTSQVLVMPNAVSSPPCSATLALVSDFRMHAKVGLSQLSGTDRVGNDGGSASGHVTSHYVNARIAFCLAFCSKLHRFTTYLKSDGMMAFQVLY